MPEYMQCLADVNTSLPISNIIHFNDIYIGSEFDSKKFSLIINFLMNKTLMKAVIIIFFNKIFNK